MITITVPSGDTLSGIAVQYNSSVSAIAQANGIADPNLVYAGETLVIPVGSTVVTATLNTAPAPSSTVPIAQSSPSPSSTGSAGGSFGACVRFRENTDSYSWGTGNGGGAYQFEPSTWAAFAPAGAVYGQASPAQQDQAFQNAVAALGTSPWSPYDHC